MYNRLKKTVMVLVVTLLVIGLFLSTPSADDAMAQTDPYKIFLVSHGGPGDPFWGRVIKGMKDADASLDEVDAQYLGPEKFSIGKLIDFLETAESADPAGIGVTITNHKPLDRPLRRIINRSNIPVIAFNVPDPRPKGERIPYMTYIGQSPYVAGKGSAERMLEDHTPERAVVSIHEPGHSALEARARGIMDVLKENGVPVEKLATSTEAGQTIGIIQSYLNSHPGVDTIFTLGPLDTHPVIQMIKEQNLGDELTVGAFDLTVKTLKAIRDGTVVYTVDQQPYLQGYMTVQWLFLHAKYGLSPTEENLLTGPAIVDESNVNKVMDMVEKGVR